MACGDDKDNSEIPNDAGADGDADGDTDGDTDMDTCGDTDTDTDGDDNSSARPALNVCVVKGKKNERKEKKKELNY